MESSASCSLSIDAVRLRAEKCCQNGEEENIRNFRLRVINVGNSPETNVSIRDILNIPPNVTVQFTSFDGCDAVFAGDMAPVPLNTNITNRTILITCDNLIVPQGGSVTKLIGIRIVGTTAFITPGIIENILAEVTFLNTDDQVLLGIDNVPVSARVEVIGQVQCLDPC